MMKKYYLIILLSYLSYCSFYNLSNPKLDDLFNPSQDPSQDPNQILLVSPNLESPIIADSILLSISFNNTHNIQSISLLGADGFKTNIDMISPLSRFDFNHRIVISNKQDYHTSKKFYNLKATQINENNQHTERNYSIPIQLLSVHLAAFIHPPLKPPTPKWDANEVIQIIPASTGAGIKNITITGNIGSFHTNISKPYNPIVINISKNLSEDIPKGQITANIKITSDTGGITNIGFNLP
ncbi:MAG: hypothetical protein ACRC0X_05575 [Brevinema sp.]